MTPLIRIHNLEDNTIEDREMNAQELKQLAADKAQEAVIEKERAAKVEALAKLAALGLTTDDLKALGLGGN
jgi:hypothetical protein